MSIRDLAFDVGALAAVLALGLGVGYVRGDSHGVESMNPKVLAAQQAQAKAEQAAKQASDALGTVRSQLATQQQELKDASARAAQALKDRAVLTTQLATATRERINQDRKALHETNCMALDSVPVCPVLAHRLFDQPAEGSSAADAPASH